MRRSAATARRAPEGRLGRIRRRVLIVVPLVLFGLLILVRILGIDPVALDVAPESPQFEIEWRFAAVSGPKVHIRVDVLSDTVEIASSAWESPVYVTNGELLVPIIALGSVPPLAATTDWVAIDLVEIPQVPEFAVDDLRGFVADISFHRCSRPTPTMLEYFDFFVPGQAEAIRSEEICGWGATHMVQREQRSDPLNAPVANLVSLDGARIRSILAFLGLAG